jgi:hypothetical protein
MANPFPFVAGNVLTAAQLNGIGEWTSYTPVLTATTTNPTLGTGSSATGAYARVQNLIVYNFQILFGSSGVVAGVGNYKVSLPVTSNATNAFYTATNGCTAFFDSSANSVYFANAWLESTTNLTLLTQASFNGALQNVSATSPAVPAANDAISGLVIYRAA